MSRQGDYERRKSAEGADIGDLPPVVNWHRRNACALSLLLFLQTYFPNSTGLTLFSQDHVGVIDRIENCLLYGGRFANAVYRGFSKTTITENAAIWGILYGYRRYVAVYSADQTAANQLIDSITRELSENDLLAEDFPEVCVPFQKLEGMHQRCRSQTHHDDNTHIRIVADHIVFPSIKIDGRYSAASGGIIRAKGITSPGRGQAIKRADGVKARPDFALIDDPQTDESAKSPGQVKDRLDITAKGILKSAGHMKSIACVVNGTVIRVDDYMDQLLDHKRNPSWDSVRVPMVKAWSSEHDGLWLEYKTIRHGFDPEIVGDQRRAHAEATEFYRAKQAAMDSGCVVSWKSCYDPDVELTAIQHAYNLFLDDGPDVFDSECQQSPKRGEVEGLETLVPAVLAKRTNGIARGCLPTGVTTVVAGLDLHEDVHYWKIMAAGGPFNGFVLDYGTFPQQPPGYFEKRKAAVKLANLYPKASKEDRIRLGAAEAERMIFARRFARVVGEGEMAVSRLLIDCGNFWEEAAHVARTSSHSQQITLSRGLPVGAKDTPFHERKRPDTVVAGENWYIDPFPRRGSHPVVFVDVNAWKTFAHSRLTTSITAPGAVTFYGNDPHQMLADHLTAEFAALVTARGRSCYEWELLPGRDNHWLDTFVQCLVAASMQGVTLNGRVSNSLESHQPVKVNDWFKNQKRKRR